jgi:hypothetical protein
VSPASLALVVLSAVAAPPEAGPVTRPAAPADDFRPDPGWKPLGPSLWFDPDARRLVLRAKVVLREGPLEHLLCLKGTKEHEAILATGAAPRRIHAGLLLTGAEVGHPVRFLPRFEPPAGSPIAIELHWRQDGKARKADARDWVFDERKKAPLATDWVFAGSLLVAEPGSKEPYYAADDGDLFTVANFANAILDLPFASTANDTDRAFVARTDHIPPVGTGVTLYLRPRKAVPPPSATPTRK